MDETETSERYEKSQRDEIKQNLELFVPRKRSLVFGKDMSTIESITVWATTLPSINSRSNQIYFYLLSVSDSMSRRRLVDGTKFKTNRYDLKQYYTGIAILMRELRSGSL